MESLDSEGEPIVKVAKSNDDATHLTKMEKANVNNTFVTCGFCEACRRTEDCNSCDNCSVTYIEKYIKYNQNFKPLPCLKRDCSASSQGDFNTGAETFFGFSDHTDKLRDSQASKPKTNLQNIDDSWSNMELKEPDEIGIKSGIKMEQEMTSADKYKVKMDYAETVWEQTLVDWEDKQFVMDDLVDKQSEIDDWEVKQSEIDDGEVGNKGLQIEMCGKCLGCTAPDCGKCWPCIEKYVIATKELASKIKCKFKKCLVVKKKQGNNNEIKQKRKRCGSCPGCSKFKISKNCGICKLCIRKQRDNLIGKINNSTCTSRKCHVLKSEKSQRCGECNGCQSLPCKDCASCNTSTPNFCRVTRCKNPSWVKIKNRTSKNDKMFGLKMTKTNEDLDVSKDEQMLTENVMKNENISFEEDPFMWEGETENESNILNKKQKLDKLEPKFKIKQGSSKSLKRTKKCGECDGCLSEECGTCESCKINQQFGDRWLILGKVPCLMDSCKFPLLLKGDDMKTLMANQDDASEGSVCPVKVVNGVLSDYRCYYCKKLPRVGSANRSELLRHYSTNHFAQELRNEFSDVLQKGYCPYCEKQLKHGFCVASHFGQTHGEVMKYLPTEALALCPKKNDNSFWGKNDKKIVKQRLSPKKAYNQNRDCDWPQVPEGYDPSANNRNWKSDSANDNVKVPGESQKMSEIVDGWTIEYDPSEDSEPPNENDPDYSGEGGICSVCGTQFGEVTEAATHLHKDHHIKGGSSYMMRDCQNFIKSGFIKLVSRSNESCNGAVSVIKHTNEMAKPAVTMAGWVYTTNSRELVSPQLPRNMARKSTNTSSTPHLNTAKSATSPWNAAELATLALNTDKSPLNIAQSATSPQNTDKLAMYSLNTKKSGNFPKEFATCPHGEGNSDFWEAIGSFPKGV